MMIVLVLVWRSGFGKRGRSHYIRGYSVADFGCWCFNGVDGYRSREEIMIQPVILEKLA
ncbi:hypothetical protein QUA20_01425 [Microcoleus sp. Pol7_A1]|uniref:hypothetical protein n=1 Tax=Microcoleus sp. Pol7_A1 TaxID=2818893 RepID=UPI002FCFB564